MATAQGASWKFISPPPLWTIFPLRDRAARRAAPPAAKPALPGRRLRLAEFLFHAGRVEWKECCAALQWQRSQRPMAGRIAMSLGYLDQAGVTKVLRLRVEEKAFGTPFCAFAVSKGLLTERQAHAVIAEQRRQQRRIGEYFVDAGLLEREEVETLEREMRRHNLRFPAASASR